MFNFIKVTALSLKFKILIVKVYNRLIWMIVVWIPIVLYMPDLEWLLMSLKLKVTKQRSIRFLAIRAIYIYIYLFLGAGGLIIDTIRMLILHYHIHTMATCPLLYLITIKTQSQDGKKLVVKQTINKNICA